VGSGQWVVGSKEIKTVQYPLPTAHYFPGSFHLALRGPEKCNEDVSSSAFRRSAHIIEPGRMKAELRTILRGENA
jgi:hypothetical protein